MTAQDYLELLQRDIHSAVFATVDDGGLPQTCVIDLMLADAGGLYFLTARGKSFYERLARRPYVALSGMRGGDTLSTVAVSVRGAVRSIGTDRLDEIFEKNPYMARIYPTVESRRALVVFQLYRGEGEFFDLSRLPPFREAFAFGGEAVRGAGYHISGPACTGCGACRAVCPSGCIAEGTPHRIDQNHCIHCGNCLQACPEGAVERL